MIARTHITTATLALAGAGLWYAAGTTLKDEGRFENQPNPLGIKRSPYGQVLAMAIQTPIDGDWHGGLEVHDHAADEHDHHVEDDHDGRDHDHGLCDHDHEGHDHDGCTHDHGGSLAANASLIDRLQYAVSERTNPNPPTAGHQFYLRREIEKKLRFAYELDPSHYANYNSYHLFLTQRQLGTGALSPEEARKAAFTLADRTIRYCLREQHDPRPALTAASAAYNVLEQMLLAEHGTYPLPRMREQLKLMDFCISRHVDLLDASLENGQWALLSPQRQQEVVDRSKFTMKLRQSAEKAIQRREFDQHSTASHEGS